MNRLEIPQRSSLPAHFGVLSFVSGSMEGAGSAHTGLDAQHAVDGDDFASRRSLLPSALDQ
jgi:hypothetical protein